MDRSNHYEAALEAYLQWHRLCYVAVDETRRVRLGGTSVKNLDFIICSGGGAGLLVDVKGRRFPSGSPHRPQRVWQSWCEQDDVIGLCCWQELFGPGFEALLVFAYHILPGFRLPDDTEDLWTWRGRRYLLRAVPATAYREHMRVRSPRWGTIYLPGEAFRRLARPLHDYTHPRQAAASEVPF